MKKLSIYWLTIEPDEIHKNKVKLMEEKGFEVFFFKTLDSLTKELHNRRASIIIVGDEGPEVIVVKAISLLRRMPDIQGARLILSTSRHSPVVLRAAACEGFRDILPIHMEDEDWIERFLFSTAGLPGEMRQDTGYVPAPFDATLAIPARIVWMSPTRLWIESRIFPPAGTRIAISGPMAQAMGYKFIDLEIEELHQNNLIYRFSEALVGNWQVPDHDNPKVREAMHVLKDLDVGERYKVFLAIQSPALRAALLRYLSHPKFEVHTALQKRSMIDEPKYFSPDLVFVEDRLCRGESLDRFRAMVANLPENTSIVVVGSDKDLTAIRAAIGKRRLTFLKRIPVNLDQLVFSEFLGPQYQRQTLADKDASFIPYDHEFSLAELNIPAQVEKLGADGAMISVPNEIGNFGMTRVKAPFLEKTIGRNPYAKITAIQFLQDRDDGLFPYRLDCRFSDVHEEQQEVLREKLEPLRRGEVKDLEAFFEVSATEAPKKAAKPVEEPKASAQTAVAEKAPTPVPQPRVEQQETARARREQKEREEESAIANLSGSVAAIEDRPSAANWLRISLLLLLLIILMLLAGIFTRQLLQENITQEELEYSEQLN